MGDFDFEEQIGGGFPEQGNDAQDQHGQEQQAADQQADDDMGDATAQEQGGPQPMTFTLQGQQESYENAVGNGVKDEPSASDQQQPPSMQDQQQQSGFQQQQQQQLQGQGMPPHGGPPGMPGPPFAGPRGDPMALQEAVASGCKVYIANLYWWTTDAEVETMCKEYGEIASHEFLVERSNGKSKGVVLVEFTSPEAAIAAKDGLNGRMFQGRSLAVTFHVAGPGARPGPPFSVATMEGLQGGRGGGGGGGRGFGGGKGRFNDQGDGFGQGGGWRGGRGGRGFGGGRFGNQGGGMGMDGPMPSIVGPGGMPGMMGGMMPGMMGNPMMMQGMMGNPMMMQGMMGPGGPM